MHSVKSSVAGNADNVAHRYAIFLCSLDVEIANGQYKDYLIGQQTTITDRMTRTNMQIVRLLKKSCKDDDADEVSYMLMVMVMMQMVEMKSHIL